MLTFAAVWEWFDPDPWESLGGRYPEMPWGRCFLNSFQLTRRFPELIYVEGTAFYERDIERDEPKPHASCATSEGLVVDATWRNDVVLYGGVVFPRQVINRIALDTGFWREPALGWLMGAGRRL